MPKADPAEMLVTVARLVADAPSLRDVVSRLAVALRASIPFERLHVLRLDRADSFVLYVARETGEIEMTEHRVGDSATPLDAVDDASRSRLLCTVRQGARVHGALYADRLDPFAAFKPDDLELISAVAAQTAIAVENARAHERLAREEVARANYSRFLPEYVVKQMLDNPESFKLGGVNQTITVLFADIRGFTRISEHAPPEQIVSLLNRYFSAMTDIIFAHGGTLDKYLGDGLMALFGAPTTTPDDASNALNAAVAMQRRLLGINRELRDEGFPEIGVGMGLALAVERV